jgi:hypothetical protein
MPAVTFEEDAMTRLESPVWPLAGGSGCVFVLAIVLDRLPWQAAFVAVLIAVMAWSWMSPVVAAAAVGGIAWLCVTGFDVHRFGHIEIDGHADPVRAVVLVLAGALTASLHAAVDAMRRYRRADPAWVDFYATGQEPKKPAEPAP